MSPRESRNVIFAKQPGADIFVIKACVSAKRLASSKAQRVGTVMLGGGFKDDGPGSRRMIFTHLPFAVSVAVMNMRSRPPATAWAL